MTDLEIFGTLSNKDLLRIVANDMEIGEPLYTKYYLEKDIIILQIVLDRLKNY